MLVGGVFFGGFCSCVPRSIEEQEVEVRHDLGEIYRFVLLSCFTDGVLKLCAMFVYFRMFNCLV